jgi:hypothetical protein
MYVILESENERSTKIKIECKSTCVVLVEYMYISGYFFGASLAVREARES